MHPQRQVFFLNMALPASMGLHNFSPQLLCLHPQPQHHGRSHRHRARGQFDLASEAQVSSTSTVIKVACPYSLAAA